MRSKGKVRNGSEGEKHHLKQLFTSIMLYCLSINVNHFDNVLLTMCMSTMDSGQQPGKYLCRSGLAPIPGAPPEKNAFRCPECVFLGAKLTCLNSLS